MIGWVVILSTFAVYSHQLTTNEVIEGYMKVLEPLKPACVKESGANPDLLDNAIKNGKFPDDKASKCFWKCFFRKLELLNDKEEIQEEKIRQFIGVPDKKVSDEIFEKCAHLRETDICETMDAIGRCVYSATIAAAEK